jgi:PBP1b-binding outer membrane lipoprotein LpoB
MKKIIIALFLSVIFLSGCSTTRTENKKHVFDKFNREFSNDARILDYKRDDNRL